MLWLGRSRHYSPLNRAVGLRRVPDRFFGLGFLASLILHAALVTSLIRLTDALPERPGEEDATAVLMDLTAGTPANSAVSAAVATPAPSGAPGAAVRSAATMASASQSATGSRHGAGATTASPAHTPATAPRSEPVTASLPAAPPVEASRPAPNGPTLVSVMPASTDGTVVTPPLAFDSDTPLDAGWPAPPPMTVASKPPATVSAKTLIPVPRIPDVVQRAVDPAPPALLVQAPPAPTAGPWVEATKPPGPVAVTAELPAAAPAPARSLFGLNRDRALVRFDGPRIGVSDEPTRTVSGTVLGGVPERLVVYVNGVPTDVTPAGRTFEIAAALRPGTNELRAVVTSAGDLEAEDTVTVQYVPRASSSGIALTSPPDGLTLGPDDPPIARVEGEVDDKNVTTVWIVANDRRIPVTASAGRFRHTLLVPDPQMRLWAEAADGDTVRRSGTVTVRTAGARPPSGVLVVQWPAGTDGSSVEVSATWRAQSERLDTLVQTFRLPAVEETTNGTPAAMFHLRGLKPGVYTLMVRYRGAAPLGDAQPTLYLPDKDHLAPRALRPVSLNGAGRRIVAKVLMPQAVLWSQDDWFSGRSESVDTVTKFRIPEGISWVERKADLP